MNLPFSAQKSDVYSLGVVLFTLATGMFPFELKERCCLLENGGKPKVDWSHRDYPRLSASLMELLDGMLEADPIKRISMRMVLGHKWVTKRNWLSLISL